MIRVFIPPSFIPERSYAVNTLLHHFLDLDIEIIARKGQIHYEITWDDKSIVVYDQFFGHTYVGETYVKEDRIPETAVEAQSEGFDNIINLFGHDKLSITPHSISSEIDLFAGAFFMLTRWEESFRLHEDLHGRFPAASALIVKSGFILRPVVDEYVALLKKWFELLGQTFPNSNKKFNIIPTCDADVPYYWLSRPAWWILARRFLKHKSLRQLQVDRKTIRNVKEGIEKDPCDNFDYMMTAAESRGLSFRFYFLAGGETRFEKFYTLGDPRIQQLIGEIKRRGHETGLHPSYNSFTDHKMISRERIALEEATGHPVRSSRQHFLRFMLPQTWQHLDNAYIKEDSTMGYAAEPGFRCGTSHPFPVFDIYQKKQLSLMERPLLVMDASLRYYKKFTIEESKAYCAMIQKQVKKHNGDFVFLWHNSSIGAYDGWEGWEEVFESLLFCP